MGDGREESVKEAEGVEADFLYLLRFVTQVGEDL